MPIARLRNAGTFRVALSKDGKTLAACFGTTGIIRVFDMASGNELQTLKAADRPMFRARVLSLAFGKAPDGRVLVTAGAGSAPQFVDVATGKRSQHRAVFRPNRCGHDGVGAEPDSGIHSAAILKRAFCERSRKGPRLLLAKTASRHPGIRDKGKPSKKGKKRVDTCVERASPPCRPVPPDHSIYLSRFRPPAAQAVACAFPPQYAKVVLMWRDMCLDADYAEAVRRIHEAHATGQNWLDFGDLAIARVPDEIALVADHLQILALGTEQPIVSGDNVEWRDDFRFPPGGVVGLEALETLTHLTSLSLAWCIDVTNIEPLRALTQLKSLNLSACNVESVEPLRALAKLESLSLALCHRVTSLEPLCALSHLNSLDLSRWKSVTAIEPVRVLTQLTSLSLAECIDITSLELLEALTQLESLNLARCLRVTSLNPLRALTKLKSLNLAQCRRVNNLNPLRALARLESLSLARCQRVTSLEPLRALSHLTSLDLSRWKNATTLDAVRMLTKLTSLNLADCVGITSLDLLESLTQIESLNLARCVRVTNVEPLRTLAHLKTLNVSFCKSAAFAPIRERLGTLQELIAYGSCFPDLPVSVCGEHLKDNVVVAVRAYFDDLDRGCTQDTELKAFVLGNGNVGKTKLVGRLCGIPFGDIPEGSTHGVRLHSHDLPVAGLSDTMSVRLNLWDFGGQDIYHGTHALFIRPPAIYLILWSHDCENENEVPDTAIVMKNRRLPYWFDYLRQEIGEERDGKWVVNAPVILVQSKCENLDNEKTPPFEPDPTEFPHLDKLHFSAFTDHGIEDLVSDVKKAIRRLFTHHPSPPLPESWVKVRAELRGLQAKTPPTRTLSAKAFQQMCEPHGVSKPEVLRDVLHRMGVVFHRTGLFEDQIIVDQSWVLDAVYTLFNRHQKFQREVRKNGRFTRDDLDRYFWSNYSGDEQRTFLSFMEQCGICFEASPNGGGGPEYIAPDLLPAWCEKHEKQFRRQLADQSGAGVTVTFGVLHDGILRSILAQIGEFASEGPIYWKFGCHFHDSDTEILIRTDANTLQMKAWGNGAAELLKTLLEMLKRIPSGQPPVIAWYGTADEPEVPKPLEPSEVANPNKSQLTAEQTLKEADELTEAPERREPLGMDRECRCNPDIGGPPPLSDRQLLILRTMLEHGVVSERRRKTQADIVRLINRKHKSSSYTRDFANLVKSFGYLESSEGPTGGMWIRPNRKVAVEQIVKDD